MKTQIHTIKQNQYHLATSNKLILASLLLLTASSVFAAGNFQQNVLLSPSNSMLMAEAGGRIMIYDGLKSETINTAMDTQFNRIENMMFVRTQYVQESGEYEVEDDGCD